MNVSRKEKAEIAMYCWSIVDQFHAIARLLKAFEIEAAGWPKLDEFKATVNHLRNKMDHLGQNLGNLGAKKGTSYPLHGSVLFGTAPSNVGEYECIVVNLGAFHQEGQHSPTIDLNELLGAPRYPAIFFAAFDANLNVTALHWELSSFLKAFNDAIEQSSTEMIRKRAQERGIDPESLLQDTIFEVVAMRMKMRSGSSA